MCSFVSTVNKHILFRNSLFLKVETFNLRILLEELQQFFKIILGNYSFQANVPFKTQY